MDRTAEFLRVSGKSGNGGSIAEVDSTEGASKSSFNAEAAKLGNDIHSAQLKLDELGKLVRQKSLFSDSASRIGLLTDSVAHDISVLTTRVDTLSRSVGAANNRQMEQYSEALVQTLRQRLAEIVRGLQEISELRVRIMQEQDSRRNKFSFAPSISSQVASSGSYANPDTTDPESGRLLTEQATDQYRSSRLTSVQGIQRTIAELGQIFTRMATTLQHQEEMVARIDSTIDSADSHIKEGTNQLMIYYNSMSSNRRLILKIFAILIIFAFIMALTS